MCCSIHCWTLSLAALALGFSGAGCAPGKGEVSGKVTYNNAPLDKLEGSIVFVSPGGIQVVAPIASDGTYRASEVMRGENKVAVYYRNPKYQEALHQMKAKKIPIDPKAPSPLADIPQFFTPAKYASEVTSGFTVKVEAITTFNADLIGPPLK